MYEIFNSWKKDKKDTEDNEIKKEFIIKNNKLKKEFMQYYNENYHEKEWKTDEKKMSKNIHMYLHELDYTWKRIEKYKEFKKTDVMEQLGEGIEMDKELIMIYLVAHWIEHYGEEYNEIENKFWKDVPNIVNAASEWKKKF